jgi:hypothetical protein
MNGGQFDFLGSLGAVLAGIGFMLFIWRMKRQDKSWEEKRKQIDAELARKYANQRRGQRE